jgi:hypothetical protein
MRGPVTAVPFMLAKSGFQLTEFAHHVAGPARSACAVLDHIAAQLRGADFLLRLSWSAIRSELMIDLRATSLRWLLPVLSFVADWTPGS